MILFIFFDIILNVTYIFLRCVYIQGGTFKVLQAIIYESIRRIKNMFRQKLCDIEWDIRYYRFDLG